jgi:hypothetical protein
MDWLVALDPDGRPTNTFRHVGLYPGLGVEAVRLVPAQNRGLAMGAYTVFSTWRSDSAPRLSAS